MKKDNSDLPDVFTAKELGEMNLDMDSVAEHETAYRRGYYHALCHHYDKLAKAMGEDNASLLCEKVYEWRREAYKGQFFPPPVLIDGEQNKSGK